MLRLAGLPGAGDADESVFERLGPKDELRMRWQRIQGVVEECQHLNEANGRLVALQRRQVEQALQALNGGGNADVYGPDGARDQLGVNRLTTSA